MARALETTLETANENRRARILNARGDNLARAFEVTLEAARGEGGLLPTWRRYDGVVWSQLSPGTLEARERRRLLVPSALYGLSAGDERIGEFRLKFTVSLEGVGPLARLWRRPLAQAIDSLGRRDVLNLLPEEHHRAIEWTEVRRPRVRRVRFLSADGESVVGHDAKAVKGALARYVLDEGLDALAHFSWRGWTMARIGDVDVMVAPT